MSNSGGRRFPFIDMSEYTPMTNQGGGAKPFSGTVYFKRTMFTDKNLSTNKPYVKADENGATITVTEELGPPSNPWQSGEYWREKAYVSGHLYIDC